MKSFHFSLGNSTDGPIGFCARVTAESRDAAVDILRLCIGDTLEMRLRHEQVEYANVYFNEDAITVADIDEEEDA